MSSVEKARIRNENLLKVIIKQIFINLKLYRFFQSILKLNNEIDKNLKQPDSAKFTTLKVNTFPHDKQFVCLFFINIISFRVIIGIWLANYYQYGNMNQLNMKNENDMKMKIIYKKCENI